MTQLFHFLASVLQTETLIWKDTCTHVFIQYSYQDMKTIQTSNNRWKVKEVMAFINNEMLFDYQERWNIAVHYNMDGTDAYHFKRNK